MEQVTSNSPLKPQGTVAHAAGADRKRAAFINRALKLPVIAGVTQDEGTALGAHMTVGDQMPNVNTAIHGVLLPGGALSNSPSCGNITLLISESSCGNTDTCILAEFAQTWHECRGVCTRTNRAAPHYPRVDPAPHHGAYPGRRHQGGVRAAGPHA